MVDVFKTSFDPDRSFFRFDGGDVDLDVLRQNGIRPAARAKAANGRHDKRAGIERHDGPACRMVIGGAASGRRNQSPSPL